MGVIYDNTGKGIGKDNPLAITHVASDIMQPVEIQGRYAQTIQTHNAVSIGAGAWSIGTTWIDCSGYDEIGLTLANNAFTSSRMQVLWSHDGVTQHGLEDGILAGTNQHKVGLVKVKARYAKVSIENADTIAHTMSAWVYLRA